MKKILFTFLAVAGFISANAQRDVWFNEIYAQASAGNTPFIELYNTSLTSINLGCYVMVSYWDVKKTGSIPAHQELYVYNFPAESIDAQSYYTISTSSTISFKCGGSCSGTRTLTDPNAYDIYSASNISVYSNVSGSWSGPTASTTTNFVANQVGVLLYKVENGTTKLVNGFLGGTSTVPTNLKSIPDLTVNLPNCSSSSTATLTFGGITVNNVEVSSVGSASGSDNGYGKLASGICGNWVKATQSSEFTPSKPNQYSSAKIITPVASTLQQVNVCDGTEELQFKITSTSSSTIWDVLVTAYYDNGITSGVLDVGDQPIAQVNTTITSSDLGMLFIDQIPLSADNVIVVYQTNLGCFNNVITAGEVACSVLPVHFTSFTAVRKADNVVLNWTTASEQNSKGFYVQRSLGGAWKDIAFMFSKTAEGTSTQELSYNFTDVNPTKGVSQYRILQVDLNDNGNYSQVLSVSGNAASGKLLVYPNPSNAGSVTLVFATEGVKSVVVSDASGRLVQQYHNIAGTTLNVKNLISGFYAVQVQDVATGATTTEKFVIKKR